METFSESTKPDEPDSKTVPPAVNNRASRRHPRPFAGMSKHSRPLAEGNFSLRKVANGEQQTMPRATQASYTKRYPWTVRAENRKQNKAARQARKANR